MFECNYFNGWSLSVINTVNLFLMKGRKEAMKHMLLQLAVSPVLQYACSREGREYWYSQLINCDLLFRE